MTPSFFSISDAAASANVSAQYMRVRSDDAGMRISKYASLPRFSFRAALTASLMAK